MTAMIERFSALTHLGQRQNTNGGVWTVFDELEEARRAAARLSYNVVKRGTNGEWHRVFRDTRGQGAYVVRLGEPIRRATPEGRKARLRSLRLEVIEQEVGRQR